MRSPAFAASRPGSLHWQQPYAASVGVPGQSLVGSALGDARSAQQVPILLSGRRNDPFQIERDDRAAAGWVQQLQACRLQSLL
jgi:hypothetical protein